MFKAAFALVVLLSAGLGAEPPTDVPAEASSRFEFIRTLDVEAAGAFSRRNGEGAQLLRIRTRYLDPDPNAFVGLLTGLQRFNDDLLIGKGRNEDSAAMMWNWGINLGLRCGAHLWELDLMGVVLGSTLGPAAAIAGEHSLGRRLTFYHRTEANFFTGDTQDALIDQDQGLYWMWSDLGLSIGYRLFAASRLNRSGPHAGLRLRFESPKIPFLFPSMG